MAKKNEEIDIDEEIKRISRKTNVDILKSGRTFDNRIKNLELWTKIFGSINGPYCLISDLTPSHFFIISNIFPEIIALFIG